MSEPKHMNRGFLKDKLGSYQVDPPDKVWDAIAEQIGKGRKRRGMYILLLATAASIALAISLGIYFFGPDLPTEPGMADESGIRERIQETPPAMGVQQAEALEKEAMTGQSQENAQIRARQESPVPEVAELLETKSPEADPGDSDPSIVPLEVDPLMMEQQFENETGGDMEMERDSETVRDSETDRDPEPELLPDSAIENTTDPFPVVEPGKVKDSRWMVGAAVSPLYSYRDADAMAMPPGPDETGLLSYSAGVQVRYRRNSRLSFETGIFYNRTGIEIGASGIRILSRSFDNMIFGMGSESADINSVSNSVGNIVAHSGDIYINGYKVSSENGVAAVNDPDIYDNAQIAESGIQQHLDFLELPFNLRYSLIDRSFELQLVGGVSTNFLVGNSVTMNGSSGREEIGYLSNVNTVNYSGNAGLGMIYHMGRKMSLFLEPRFRYFLNSVNDASLPATRPYSLGFYTGLNYTF